MTVEVRWYDESQRVALMRFPDHFGWADFQAAIVEVDRLLDAVTHPCALVLQFGQRVPPLGDSLVNGRAMLARRHRRAARFILVTDSVYVRALGTMLGQIVSPGFPLITVAATLDEAAQLLREAGFPAPAPMTDSQSL